MSTPVTPVDPASERGRQIARELTEALDDIEARIEAERTQQTSGRDRAA